MGIFSILFVFKHSNKILLVLDLSVKLHWLKVSDFGQLRLEHYFVNN